MNESSNQKQYASLRSGLVCVPQVSNRPLQAKRTRVADWFYRMRKNYTSIKRYLAVKVICMCLSHKATRPTVVFFVKRWLRQIEGMATQTSFVGNKASSLAPIKKDGSESGPESYLFNGATGYLRDWFILCLHRRIALHDSRAASRARIKHALATGTFVKHISSDVDAKTIACSTSSIHAGDASLFLASK